jgi:hypothetical protein
MTRGIICSILLNILIEVAMLVKAIDLPALFFYNVFTGKLPPDSPAPGARGAPFSRPLLQAD